MFNLDFFTSQLRTMNDKLIARLDDIVERLDTLIELEKTGKVPPDGSHWDHGPHLRKGLE